MPWFRCALTALCLASTSLPAAETLNILFLGDNGHHRPEARFHQLEPVLARKGIALTYTDDPAKALQPETLARFDGLLLYANIDRIEPAQADALLEYVASGKGFIPLHCATYCFRNDERVVALMGGQFLRHGGEVFGTVIAQPEHPLMRGFGGFTSWDETYVHTRHNERDRTVLEYRVQGMQAEGNDREPWTWIRTHGQGRVFYTAWGHDERTWSHPGFHNLVERGIRWACGDDPAKAGPYRDPTRFDPPPMAARPADLPPLQYVDVGAKIPHYVPSDRWGTQAEPLTLMQTPLPPEQSLKRYVVPEGFELRLFACESRDQSPESRAEPPAQAPPYAGLGGKPIAMNWDERGRLWVCETLDYPNELHPQNRGRDRIRICEDADGDGQADKFTIFAEGLSIPTAVLPIYGGALVQNGTETLFLKDVDGDDRADLRVVLLTGWAMNDTHGGVSNFRYGLDNWVYAMQGYNDSQPVIAATGEKGPRFRQGFWRMKLTPPADDGAPTVETIEFLRSTNNNTWGLGISEEGLIFGSTANHNPSDFLPIPNRYYERVRGWGPAQLTGIADSHLFRAITDKVRQVDHFGGYTAGCGHALYTAREYPLQYWNRTAFVCEPTGHLVGTFVLLPDGAGFKSTSPCNLVASDDEWAAPIMAEVGPDGHVWILDWYNYIVQHNPTPQGFRTGKGNAYESDLRDKKHGRIYRLVYTGQRQPGEGLQSPGDGRSQPDDGVAGSDPLLLALQSPTMLVRLHAQRLLVEQQRHDLIPSLLALVQDPRVDEIGLNVGAIHALWTLHGLDVLAPDRADVWSAVTAALRHPSPGVRRNALQVLPPAPEATAAVLASGALDDTEPQVRLAALLALADLPPSNPAVSKLVDQALDQAGTMSDRWLADAVTSAAAAHPMEFLAALARMRRERQEPATTSDAPIWQVTRRAAEHIARGRPTSAEVNRLVALLDGGDDFLTGAVLAGLSGGWPRGHQVELSAESEGQLARLLDRVEAGAKGQVLRLASLWGSQALEQHAAAIVSSLLKLVRNPEEPLPVRADAAAQLIGFRSEDDEVVVQLLDSLTPQTPPQLAARIIDALAGSTAPNVGAELVQRAGAMTPLLKETAVRVLLARPQTTLALLDGIRNGQLQLSDLKLDQRTALSNHPDRQIRRRAQEVLTAGGGLPNPDRQKVIDEFLELTRQTGDVALGKEIFKKHCGKCHRHSGEGENIGPDLTGMVVHPKAELLVHILDPSRSVEGNFRSYTVVMNDGLIFNGMLAGESQTTIDLIDTEAKKHSLVREDIDQLIASNKSVMPEGFEKTITREEFVHLLEFLTAKGKYVPLDLRKAATIVSTRAMFVNESNDAEKLIFPDWSPKVFRGVPFLLVDPRGDQIPNVVLLYGPQGKFPPQMPRSVSLPVNAKTKTVHLLSGVSGWGHPFGREGSVSLIVRLHYADGTTEDHELRNGVHFADYIRRVDVPGSEFAFRLRGQQIRYLAVEARRPDVVVERLELVKGPDETAPVVMAVTVETP